MTRKQWAALSPEEQRIKVAELCGWERRKPDSNGIVWWKHPIHGWKKPVRIHPPYSLSDVPDYLNDLNAMHKAEKYPALKELDDSRFRYVRNLSEITSGEPIFATAAQRAEAFVLTMEAGDE